MVSDLVFIVLFAATIIQTARVSKWREKYRLEVVRHAVTADEKAQGETIMNDATTTIALATKISRGETNERFSTVDVRE